MKLPELLQNYTVMMSAGLILGLVIGGFPTGTKEISMASLAVAMTLSLSTVRLSEARTGDHVRHAGYALLVNYVALTGLILGIGLFFSEDLWPGWVLMAAAPSAVSVVPFTTMLGGSTTKSLFSTAVNYLVALALMPVITLFILGEAVEVSDLLFSLVVLIAIPMIASRLVLRAGLSKATNSSTMNLSFAILIFAVVGANRDAFLEEPAIVLAISLACLLRTFGVGLLAEHSLKRFGMRKDERVSYVLFSSYKNLGLTATLAIALFEPVVAVPATICIVFEVVWMIFMMRYYPKAR